ncbi:hypothetical protein BGZ57DRAFT_238624 [Hyaloscypha finlandica]|nr:hypothetical protein BGZ57DRAFT_238624 [Hyaloscypha finlandica]
MEREIESPPPPFPHPGTTFPYNWRPTTLTTSTSLNKEQATTIFTTSSSYSSPTSGPYIDTHNQNDWGGLPSGVKIGICVVVVGIVIIIVLASIWCCCGCCIGGRRCGKKQIPPEQGSRGDLPLSTMPGAERRGRQDDRAVDGDLPPPQYEETAPHQHQTIAGGIAHVREEEEGVISDGKTPLSEIPFEDVVLDHPVSAGSASGSGSPSSAREFATRHHGLGGDTRGHTNS